MPKIKALYRVSTAIGLLWMATLAWADSGMLLREAKLRAEPQFQAAILQILTPNMGIDIGERRGGWRRVTLVESGQQGWVMDYKVRRVQPQPRSTSTRPAPSQDTGDSGYFSFQGISRGATGLLGFRQPQETPRHASTVGIRGLSAVELENSQPDPAQVERLELFMSPPDEAARYASSGGLNAREIAYIEADNSRTPDTDEDSDEESGR